MRTVIVVITSVSPSKGFRSLMLPLQNPLQSLVRTHLMLSNLPTKLGRSASSKRMLSSTSTTNRLAKYMQIQPEVQQAVDAGRPVVALESTIVAHGMPFPENLELAQQVETILRNKVHGSFPMDSRKSWHQDESQFCWISLPSTASLMTFPFSSPCRAVPRRLLLLKMGFVE